MAEHHYVVIYDDEKRTWTYNAEQTGYAFLDGAIYSHEAGWFVSHTEGTEELTATYDEGADMLSNLLKRYTGFPGYHTPKASA